MKKIIESFGLTVVILLMAAALLTFLAPRFGWRVDAVFSGSMEPELNVGGLVVTRPVAEAELAAGDIITFYSPTNKLLITHRVLEVKDGSLLQFQTKGDANEDADPFTVPAGNVVGKVCLHVPYLGYVSEFIKTPLGFVLTLCLPGLLVIILEMRNIWRALSEREAEGGYR